MNEYNTRMACVDAPMHQFKEHSVPSKGATKLTLYMKKSLRMIRRLKGEVVTIGMLDNSRLFASDGTTHYILPGCDTRADWNRKIPKLDYTAHAEVDPKEIMGILGGIKPSDTHGAKHQHVRLTIDSGIAVEGGNGSSNGSFHVDCLTQGSGSSTYRMNSLKDGFRSATGKTTLSRDDWGRLRMEWDNATYLLAPDTQTD